MIAKIKMIALGAGLMLAAAAVQASAQTTSPQLLALSLGGPTAAFCCSGYDTDADTGVGCYATPAGPSSVTACSGAYFECPATSFFCSPTPVKALAAGTGSGGSVENCGCGNGPNIF